MNTPSTLKKILLLTLVVGFILTACGQATTTPGQPTAAAPATGATEAPVAEQVTLRIAVLPILDALPMYVAQQKGYFETEGVKVEFIPVPSAAERDQIMAAAQADGMINDLISTLLYNKDQTQIQIVRFARTATADFPQYRVLAAGNSGITDVQGLKGVEIGISEASVIEYVTTRLLQAEGLATDEIKMVAVPKIAERMSLLASGQLKAATLPDPLSSLAIQSGAVVIIDDSKHPEYGNSVYSFRKAVIDEHPEAVRGFLAAVEKAIADVNANPAEWDTLLTEQKLVPAPLISAFQIPTLPTASLPSEAQWADVLAWAKEKNLVSTDIPYGGSVNAGFLPK